MLDSLRKPFFILAIVLLALAVLAELGITVVSAISSESNVPGIGIPYLVILDGLLLYSMLSMSATLLIPERIYGRIQGIITFIVSLLLIIASIIMLVYAFTLLILMVALFLAVPFGTLIYLGLFGDFDTGTAAALLSLIMSLKMGFAVFLILAHQRFLLLKGLVLLTLTSFVATLIISFLHALTPSILTSITDDIAGIVICILVLIWALFYFIGSIIGVVRALRFDRASA